MYVYVRACRPPVLCVFLRLLDAQPRLYPSAVHLHMMGSYKAQHLRYSRVVLPCNACHFIHPFGGSESGSATNSCWAL